MKIKRTFFPSILLALGMALGISFFINSPALAAGATYVVSDPLLTGTDCTDAGASADTDCYDSLQDAIDTATAGETILIASNLEIDHLVNVNKSLTIDGQNYTLVPTFTKTNNSNNATFGLHADSITIENLTIDGAGSTNLHGIHAYVVEDILLDGVALMNHDRSGLVVNGSTVTVNNIHTANNGWHGINVDQGGGVTTLAKLIVTGMSVQTDNLHIYLDDTTKDVEVDDTMSQYTFEDSVFHPNDRLYTLKPLTRDNCKKGGWENFSSPSFKNQGDCVSFFQSNDHAVANKEK